MADFGLSTAVDVPHKTKGLGSKNFRAPEVINGNQYGIEADIYSLGKTVEKLFDIKRARYIF